MRIVSFVALALATAAPALADVVDPLPRRAWLGVTPAPVTVGDGGTRIVSVMPGGTAERLGLKPRDILIDGFPIGPRASAPIAGTPIVLTVRRAGRSMRLSGKAVARPLESYAGATTRYGATAFGGGRLRDILVLPDGVARPPVVFLIQGYTCTSIESPNPDFLYRRVARQLLAAGIGFYRVEKPGVGDSARGAPCATMDYRDELSAFRAAYARLTGELGVSADRVFLFGHSMGGLQAPLLAAERAPRGVAVYGTVLRNWADYWNDMNSFQGFLLSGADPASEFRKANARRELLRRYFIAGESPAAIAAADPARDADLVEMLEWDGKDDVAGRHYRFWQQIAGTDHVAAWAKADTRVLSLYGESDVIAIDDEDHRLIAAIANHYRAGSARYVGFADTGHGMELIGDRETLRRRAASGDTGVHPYNPRVIETLVAWIGDVMAGRA